MNDEKTINAAFPPDLLARIDEYGELILPHAFNPHTKRGRSAVVRSLVERGLDADARKIEKARSK